jgi:DNA-binding MarR family transcriptional regulator
MGHGEHVPSLGYGVRMSIRRSSIWNMPHDDSAASSQSLERGLAILAAFTPDRPALGISELAQRLGLTRSTTHRYVATLARLGYLNPRA